jgi:hypothetical protein
MRRLAGITCGLVAMALVPSVAFADEDAPLPPSQPPPAGSVTESTTATVDTVHLRSGGMFRGRVTEIVPGDHVTVLLTTGESRRVVWRDVDRVIVASTAVPPVPGVAAPATAAMSGPRARVHIKAPSPSYLYRRAAGTTDFVTACQTPCDAEMPIGDTYKIGGSGFSTTSEFKLDAPPGGSVELTVDGPNWVGIVGGGAITIGGAATAYVGVIFALAGGSCSSSSSSRYSSSRNGCTEVRNVGLGALAVGAGMIALGLLIVFPSLKTDFAQHGSAPGKDAFVRTPTWRSASSSNESGVPTTFPLVYEGRF